MVGCSHPGIEKIVKQLRRSIHLTFPLVAAPDDVIAKPPSRSASKSTTLRPATARAHLCGAEAGIRRSVHLCRCRNLIGNWERTSAGGERRGERPALDEGEMTVYRKFARRGSVRRRRANSAMKDRSGLSLLRGLARELRLGGYAGCASAKPRPRCLRDRAIITPPEISVVGQWQVLEAEIDRRLTALSGNHRRASFGFAARALAMSVRATRLRRPFRVAAARPS